MISTVLAWVVSLKWSLIAGAVALVLGLLSMGFLGIGLYVMVCPVLRLRYPPQAQWHGDWVWPAMIGAGMGWSIGFVIAGVIEHLMSAQGCSPALSRVIYGAVLWLWALILWAVILEVRHISAE